MTALAMLEQRAFGWFHAYSSFFPNRLKERLGLNRSFTGTGTGLSKMPYIRDTRRAVGLGGFRLTHSDQRRAIASHCETLLLPRALEPEADYCDSLLPALHPVVHWCTTPTPRTLPNTGLSRGSHTKSISHFRDWEKHKLLACAC